MEGRKEDEMCDLCFFSLLKGRVGGDWMEICMEGDIERREEKKKRRRRRRKKKT